jgi:hypothetical protein
MSDQDLETRITELLREVPGLSAREIASTLEISRRAVLDVLHRDMRSRVTHDAPFCWMLLEEPADPAPTPPLLDAPAAEFARRFLDIRGLDEPDQRPLYAYRCTEAEFEALHRALGEVVDFDPLGRSRRIFAPLFVLYASEWWRRYQEPGPWAWEPVFKSIDLPIDHIMSIYPSVIAGLKQWERPLLRSSHGRLFLVTLACEGGLPLQVVKSEGARIREFFRHVLEDYGQFARSGNAASEHARRNERYLRRSLRQEIVFELGGQLIEAIWRLQARVQDVKDPVAELDIIEPSWREQLPLEINDEIAAEFLNNLVQTAIDIRRGSTQDLRIVRRMVRGAGWTLQLDISFPPSADESWLADMAKIPAVALPQRGQFVLVGSSGRKVPILNVTQRHRAGNATYVLERLQSAVIEESSAADGWTIQFESLRGSGPRREVRGGAALSDDLPWVFIEADEGLWRFLGQGSVKTRYAECAVVLPLGVACPSGESIGEVLGREIVRVSEPMEITDADGDTFRILVSQSEEHSNVIEIDGNRFPMMADEREVFVGLPRIHELHPDGRVRPVSSSLVEWRPVGVREWRAWATDCVGRVTVKVSNRGETRFLQTIEIVPEGFAVRLRGESPTAGDLEIESPIQTGIACDSTEGLSAEIEGDGRDITVHFAAAATRAVPASVDVLIAFGEERKLTLTLPFPARGARYVGRGDRILPFASYVSSEELNLCRLEAFLTKNTGRLTMDGVLHADDIELSDQISFAFDLPESSNGRVMVELRHLVPDVRALLADSDDGEAGVALSVDTLGPNKVVVRRYDVDFELGEDQHFVSLEELDPAAVEVELIPLWEPEAREVIIFDPAVGGWSPNIGSRAAGPWLLTGHTNNGVSIRPRLLTAPGEVADRSPLRTAISMAGSDSRDAIKAVLDQMVDSPLDEEWTTVVDFVKMSAEFPASSFHVTASVCANPAAAVLALIHAAAADQQLVWDTLTQAGFNWGVVPYQVWFDTLSNFGHALMLQLAGIGDSGQEMAVNQIKGILAFLEESPERRFLEPTRLFLGHHLFELVDETGDFIGVDPKVFIPSLRAARNQLVTRQTGARWPNGSRVVAALGHAPSEVHVLLKALGEKDFRFGVVAAPIFAAGSSAFENQVDRKTRGELRRLRKFDPEWYDAAYWLALVMFLNQAYEQEVA